MTYQTIVGPAIWLIPTAVTVFFVLSAWSNTRKARKAEEPDDYKERARRRGRYALYALAVTLIVSPALAFVPAGHRGVVYNMFTGVETDERPEGVTVVIPWIQHVTPINVRTQVYAYEFVAQSQDLQEVTVPIAVNLHIDPERAAEIYQEIGFDYGIKVVRPAIDQHAKAAIGQVTAEDFPQNRTELALSIATGVATQLDEYGILVEYVNIADSIFDADFMAAVRNKVIAEQNVAEARRRVQEEEYKKRQEIKKAEAARQDAILRAQGVAEANRLINESLNPQILAYLRVMQWNGILPQTLLGTQEPLDAIIQLPQSTVPEPFTLDDGETETETEPDPNG